MRDPFPVQPRLVSIGIPKAVVGVGEACSPNWFFTRISRAVVGVGEAFSAAQAGFFLDSKSCG